MNAEERCNRCRNFAPNGFTDRSCPYPPSRNCRFFSKISEREFRKIVNARIEKIRKNQEMRKEMLQDKELVEEARKNTIKYGLNVNK